MNFEQIKNKDDEYIASTYARFQVALESGRGATLYGVDGKGYIDFTSGIGVNIFGVNDEEWKEAVTAQIGKIQHACNLYYTEPQTELAELLCQKSGAKKVFLSNSGAEANECAIKAARKYNSDKYGEGKRYEILVLNNSFHGRTLTTLSATAQPAFHKHFAPFVEGFPSCDVNFDSFLSSVTEKTGAVMMELIQGESGVNPLPRDFVEKVANYCKQHDILLIIDEVQTGNGRTGYMYAYQAYGIEPDLATTAKGLGGGLPIGACMFFEKTKDVFHFGDHGSTFGGNPVCSAGALSVVKRLDEKCFEAVSQKGWFISDAVSKFKGVKGVTGMGLMIGIQTEKPAKQIAAECIEKGLIVLTAHDRVRLLPPLTISQAEIEKGLKILKEVIES
ncbi:MAG: aspartate aminotransferase family protein [Clostridia bacterium]|nr:aspartate aminotransferase family protein [Clostridia bacterium]